MPEKKVTYLETATHIAVVLLAVAIISTLALNYYERQRLPNLRPGLKKGRVFAGIPSLDYSASTKTLLIALSTDCRYCHESIPFYETLIAAQKSSGSPTRIVTIFPNSKKEVTDFLHRNNLTCESLGDVDFNSTALSGTPTMILLSPDGTIENFWVGKIPQDQESRLINEIVFRKS